jgi:outer membrane protein OmpA-like peptidoglycan-associated protein
VHVHLHVHLHEHVHDPSLKLHGQLPTELGFCTLPPVRLRPSCVCAVLTSLLLALPVLAHAQAHAHDIDIQTFTPPAGRSAAITIPDPQLPAHGTLLFGGDVSYARTPLAREVQCDASATVLDSTCVRGDADGRTPIVSDLALLDLAFAAALFDAVQLGVVLPLVLAREADDLARPQQLRTRAVLGDLRLEAGLPIAQGNTALGFWLFATLPTGDGSALVGARSASLAPSLALRQRIGKAALSVALAYRLRDRATLLGLEQDDEFEAALGFALPVARGFEARAELRGRAGLGGITIRANENPLEADLAGVWSPSPPIAIMLGAGAGVWPGRSGYGAPAFRVWSGLRYALEATPCSFGPEDHDGYRDGDGCRDPDNDGDGLDDDADACPNDAEDRDGFADGDGCPDVDNDADGLADAADACPERSEDRDGFEDDDGCPEPDNDEDAVADARDACPMDPEDKDGFEDADGCPEPGPEPVSISVAESRILVSERIYFEYDRDTLRAVSQPVLDELADVIRGLPAGTKVVVEGHTDDSGNAQYNLDLSHRRARAVVEYLRARGVPQDRLDYVGYGATRPIGPNDTPEGRVLNRRVEFGLVR